jgi:hypothetical protein
MFAPLFALDLIALIYGLAFLSNTIRSTLDRYPILSPFAQDRYPAYSHPLYKFIPYLHLSSELVLRSWSWQEVCYVAVESSWIPSCRRVEVVLGAA